MTDMGFSGLLDTSESDLEAAGNWLTSEALAGGVALWNVLKIAFLLVTSKQAQVILDVYARVQADETAGKSLEQIEQDVLQTATADELAILKEAGNVIIQGILAFIQANQMAEAAKVAACQGNAGK